MKKTLFGAMAAVLTAGALFSSCNTIEPQNASKTIQMTVNASVPENDGTKVAFGSLSGGKYNLLWTTNEQIRIFETNGEAWGDNTKSSSVTVSSDKKSATASFSIKERSGDSFHYWLAYPGGTNNWQITSGTDILKKVRQGMSKANMQTPTATGIDKNYVLMIADGGAYTSQPTNLGDVQFKYTGSFGKLTVKNLPALASGVTLSTLRITFNDKTDVTGFLDYNTETDEVNIVHGSISDNYIDINLKNITPNTTAFDIWFGILPITAAAGEKVTFTFTMSDSSTKEKVVTIPAGKPLEFARGRITGFSVDMATAAAASKTLTFDFTTTDTSKLPIKEMTRTGIGTKSTFTWAADDGKEYTFANAGGFYHKADAANAMLYEASGADYGYLGLPAIPGYKLSAIQITRINIGARDVEITSASPIGTTTALASASWTGLNPAALAIPGTSANTMYYLHSLNGGYVDIVKIILTYDPE